MGKHRSETLMRTADTPWEDIVLVCRKCARKLDGGGFGKRGDAPLRAELKHALREAGQRRRVRVVEAGCFSLCPKGAVSVMRASAPGQILVVPAGADADEVLRRLAPRPG